MKEIFFSTNLPSPYRVDFFNEWGKFCNLTVSYERLTATDRDAKWKGKEPKHFTPIYLGAKPIGIDQSIGFELVNAIKKHKDHVIILTNYVSPSVMLAITYCKLARIPYYMEHDGGFNKKDSFLKGLLKKYLLKGAKGHLTTCEQSIAYLKSLGISEEKIYKYPFTSLTAEDLESAALKSKGDKKAIRKALGMTEEKIVLYVGQMIHRKGIDILLKGAKKVKHDVGIYMVGGNLAPEYVQMIETLGLNNIHVIGFKTKEELANYYVASDVFVLPTREDIWGLVVNEAMAYGIAVISTERCIAATELIGTEEDGCVIPSEDDEKFAVAVDEWLDKGVEYSIANHKKMYDYTIEKMVESHLKIFA